MSIFTVVTDTVTHTLHNFMSCKGVNKNETETTAAKHRHLKQWFSKCFGGLPVVKLEFLVVWSTESIGIRRNIFKGSNIDIFLSFPNCWRCKWEGTIKFHQFWPLLEAFWLIPGKIHNSPPPPGKKSFRRPCRGNKWNNAVHWEQ